MRPTVPVQAGPPLELALSELVEAPDAYTGRRVRVSGQYGRLPVVVCAGNARRPPGVWALSQEETLVPAEGFDMLVNTLWPSGLTVTVEGVWRQWRGPVGCGKEAQVADIWYLTVTDIVSPTTMVQVTLTPGGIAIGAPTPDNREVEESESAAPPVGTPLAESSPTFRAEPTAPSGATATSTGTSLVTPAEGETATTTPADSRTPTPTASVTPATTAGTPGTATPTATSTATVTAGPSPTAQVATIIDQGRIAPTTNEVRLEGHRFQGGQANRFDFEVQAGETITLTVAGALDRDLTLELLDPSGATVVRQNRAPAGEAETLAGQQAGSTGTYGVVVREAQGRSAEYLLMLLTDRNYYHYSFQSALAPGVNVAASLLAENDQFWFFSGGPGDDVTITVTPSGNEDLFFNIYGPDGGLIEQFVDENFGGGTEQYTFTPSTRGLYAIQIGEANFNPAGYTVQLNVR